MTRTTSSKAPSRKRKPPKKKKKQKKKSDPVLLYSMEVVPYNITLFWSWAPTSTLYLEELHRSLPNIIPDEIPASANAYCTIYCDDGKYIPIIWCSKPELPWLLAHELVHFVPWLLGHRGLQLTDSSEEAYAYLFQFLMEMMLTTRRKNRYPNSKPKNKD